tara:strand:- start:3112 stop:4113 length:1002 start_codon:yes stop_codon:yes gene_type:complete
MKRCQLAAHNAASIDVHVGLAKVYCTQLVQKIQELECELHTVRKGHDDRMEGIENALRHTTAGVRIVVFSGATETITHIDLPLTTPLGQNPKINDLTLKGYEITLSHCVLAQREESQPMPEGWSQMSPLQLCIGQGSSFYLKRPKFMIALHVSDMQCDNSATWKAPIYFSVSPRHKVGRLERYVQKHMSGRLWNIDHKLTNGLLHSFFDDTDGELKYCSPFETFDTLFPPVAGVGDFHIYVTRRANGGSASESLAVSSLELPSLVVDFSKPVQGFFPATLSSTVLSTPRNQTSESMAQGIQQRVTTKRAMRVGSGSREIEITGSRASLRRRLE